MQQQPMNKLLFDNEDNDYEGDGEENGDEQEIDVGVEANSLFYVNCEDTLNSTNNTKVSQSVINCNYL